MTSAPNAAFGNGVFSHVDDLDDIFWSIGHPSVAVLPAALALAEAKKASGKQFLCAFVLGWEVACHLSLFFNPWHIQHGWHSTATIGIFGAAAAACKVLGLDSKRMCWALGMAACQSAGLRANFGTLTKAFHIGKVGLNGVMAAVMAENGVNATSEIFEAKRGGFLSAYTGYDKESVESIKVGLGSPWKILEPGVLFKQYPSCSGTHPAIEAVLELKIQHPFYAEDVVSVKILTDPGGPDMLTFDTPQDGLQAKFSMPFCIALAIQDGSVTPLHFTDERVRDPVIVNLMGRIHMEVDPELAKKGYLSRSDSTVRIKLKNGRKLTKRVKMARGNPERPFSDRELEKKYLTCAEETIAHRAAAESLDMIRHLEDMMRISDLIGLLCTTNKGT